MLAGTGGASVVVSVASLVSRVDDGIAARLDSAGWHPSAHTWDAFATAADGAQRAHLAYVVAAPSSRVVDGVRRRRDEPLVVRTALGVRFLHRLRPGARREDYREALAAEAVLLAAVADILRTPGVVLTVGDTVSRTELPATSGGFVLGEIPLTVLHQIDPGGL